MSREILWIYIKIKANQVLFIAGAVLGITSLFSDPPNTLPLFASGLLFIFASWLLATTISEKDLQKALGGGDDYEGPSDSGGPF